MKAAEILKQYARGERNFSSVDLRCQSFRNQNLSGANFSSADFSSTDIRGANFTNADLRGAKFCHAKAGLQCSWVFILPICSWLLSGIAGYLAGYTSYLVSPMRDKNHSYIFFAFYLFLLIFFLFSTKKKGLKYGLASVSVVIISMVSTAIVTFAYMEEMISSVITALSMIASAIFIAVAVAVNDNFASSALIIFLVNICGIFGIKEWKVDFNLIGVFPQALNANEYIFIFMIFAVTLFSSYMGWRAMSGDNRYTIIWEIAVGFSSIGGTNFHGANLTDADFTSARLKNTNFERAILIRTCWNQSKLLDHVCPGRSYLRSRQLRQWLTGKKQKEKDFDRQDLRGVNLEGAKLVGASFISADLSQANLRNAILSETNLVQTQLDGANLTGATLTGACLEGWYINSDTKLDGVICDYFYLRQGQRERRPHSEDFASRDFEKYWQTASNIVELIFRDGIDWQAFFTSFSKLQVVCDSSELSIQAFENKNDDTFVIRVNIPPDTNKIQIEKYLKQEYELQVQVLQERYQQYQLQARDEQIAIHREHKADLKEIVKVMAARSIVNSIDIDVEAKAMNESTDQSRKVKITGGTINASGAGAFSLGDISGTVANAMNQLPAAPEPDKPGIKELLERLKTTIKSEPSLSDQDKADALKLVEDLAVAGKAPQESAKQQVAKTAIRTLKGIILDLPDIAKLAEAGKTLLPMIAHLFGL